MHYTVYLDVLFLENFCMDLWLLWLEERLLKQKSRWRRRGAGAALGAFWACLWALFPAWVGKSLVGRFASFGLTVVLMQIVAFGFQKTGQLLRQSACFYAMAFFFGGILMFLTNLLGTAGFFLLFPCILITGGIMLVSVEWMREKKSLCAVRLVWRGQSICLTGLRDTGNFLYTQGSHQPVYVVDAASVCAWKQQSLENILWIPYRSVGAEGSLLPAIVIDELWIDESVCRTSPVIAFSRYPVSSDGRYQILLHSQEALP